MFVPVPSWESPHGDIVLWRDRSDCSTLLRSSFRLILAVLCIPIFYSYFLVANLAVSIFCLAEVEVVFFFLEPLFDSFSEAYS